MTLDLLPASSYAHVVMQFLIYVPSITVLILFLSGVQAARGLDTGAPLFRGDMDAGVTFEVQYERFDRDIRQEVAFTEDTFSGQQQEDRTRVYIQAYPRSNLTVRLDLGVVSSENATRVVPLVGATAKYRLAVWGDTRLSLSAGGYYVDGIKYNRSGALTPVAEFAAVERTESYIEWGGRPPTLARMEADAGLDAAPLCRSHGQLAGCHRRRAIYPGDARPGTDR